MKFSIKDPNRLNYFRCMDCLSTMTSYETPVMCACDGLLVPMGQVYDKHYGEEVVRPACDGRCTHSAGPICTCKCGGANHGTGKLVKTVVINGVVKVTEVDADAHKRAQEWREAFNAARDRFEKHLAAPFNEMVANQGKVNNVQFWTIRRAYSSGKFHLSKISQMKVHKARMEAAKTAFPVPLEVVNE
jgi:hypothetical protein